MKYFSVFEIIGTIFGVFILGFIGGTSFLASKRVFSFLLSLPKNIFINIKNNKKLKCRLKTKAEYNNLILKNFYEFIFFSFFAIMFIIISYVYFDGYIRVFTIFIFIVSFAIGNKIFGKRLLPLTEKLLKILYTYLTLITSIFTFPITLVLAFIFKFFVNPLAKKIKILKNKKITAEKIRELRFIFSK